MKKGFISIISLVAVLVLSAMLGAGVYYQHNKKISASLVENVNQNENENKENPAGEIKTESDPVESAPEEVKQEEPEIETVDVKNNVVETAEVKTDDQKKIDEELKKAEEARKQAEIAKKKAEEERAKAQEQIRVAEENRVREEAERKQANQTVQIQLANINNQLMDSSAKMAKLTEEYQKNKKQFEPINAIDMQLMVNKIIQEDSYINNSFKQIQDLLAELESGEYRNTLTGINPSAKRTLVAQYNEMIYGQINSLNSSIDKRKQQIYNSTSTFNSDRQQKLNKLTDEYNSNYKQLEIERQNLESQRQYWESQLNN